MPFQIINQIIKSITYSKVLVSFEATENIIFDERYKGGIFRDSMLNAFITLVCKLKSKPICEACQIRFDCIYYKFSTNELVFPHPLFGNKTFPPKSYIINPLPNQSLQFPKGSEFGFEIVLIGSAINQFFPTLRDVFDKMGKIGIGIGRRKFQLLGVFHSNKYGEYEFLPDTGLPHILKLSEKKIKPLVSSVTLQLETPLRFLTEKKPEKTIPDFNNLIKKLFTRIGDLSCLYCNLSDLDYRVINNINLNVEITSNILVRRGFKSFSEPRSIKGMEKPNKYDGYTGLIKYTGNIAPWAALLSAGEIINVGSTATFGLGKYSIVPNE